MKVKMGIAEKEKLIREFPGVVIVRLNENDYNIEGLDKEVLKKYGQILDEKNQDVKIFPAEENQKKEEQSQPNLQVKKLAVSPTNDVITALNTFVKNATLPLYEGNLNAVKEEFEENLKSLSDQIEELVLKLEERTIDFSRRIEEIKEQLNQMKSLTVEENKKMLDKVASLNKHLRETPLV